MAERFSITLEPEHKKVVQRFQRRVGISTFSGALQAIIHQFDAQQKSQEQAQATDQDFEREIASRMLTGNKATQ